MDANHKPVVEVTKVEEKQAKPAVAPGIKPEEADEPLLQENPQRFVLFPIKYHEVRDASLRVNWTFPVLWPPQTDQGVLDLANVQEGRGVFLDS